MVTACRPEHQDLISEENGVKYRRGAQKARTSAVPPLYLVYDLVTTSAYLPNDSMALTLNGSAKWPGAKELQRLGETRMGRSPARVREILERVRDAMGTTSGKVKTYIKSHPEFEEIGNRMIQEWRKGAAASLLS